MRKRILRKVVNAFMFGDMERRYASESVLRSNGWFEKFRRAVSDARFPWAPFLRESHSMDMYYRRCPLPRLIHQFTVPPFSSPSPSRTESADSRASESSSEPPSVSTSSSRT